MGRMSREKGKLGERDAAALIADHLGVLVRRRVRQDGGDSDLLGVPGWTIEVKRHASVTPGDVAVWWRQAVLQAAKEGSVPVLLYRANRGAWRAVWPLSCVLVVQSKDMWEGVEWTATTSIEAWCAVVRESAMASTMCEARAA